MLAWLGTTVLTQAWLSWEVAPARRDYSPRQPCKNQTTRHRVLALLYLRPRCQVKNRIIISICSEWYHCSGWVLNKTIEMEHVLSSTSPQQITGKPLSAQLSSASTKLVVPQMQNSKVARVPVVYLNTKHIITLSGPLVIFCDQPCSGMLNWIFIDF